MSETKIDTISMETHQALMEKALKDATSALEAGLERKTQDLATAQTALATANESLAAATKDVERLNTELDSAQIELKSVTEEVASLKSDIASREAAQQKAEVAAARATQVANLGLFTQDYVTEKASRWAEMPDADWADRLEEWRQLKPVAGSESAAPAAKADTASAMTGTTGALTTVPVQDHANSSGSARRAALGLN